MCESLRQERSLKKKPPGRWNTAVVPFPLSAPSTEKRVPVECVTACTAELSLSWLRGRLNLAVVDLPIKQRGVDVLPIYSEPLVAVLPHRHPLAQRPMVRLFELKKERFVLVSPQIDPGDRSQWQRCSRRQALTDLPLSQLVVLIELLDHVALHRSVGLMRSSASRLRETMSSVNHLPNPSGLRPRLRVEQRITVLVCCRSGMR
jgi:DNA-binding transcriptional LysR family regulator